MHADYAKLDNDQLLIEERGLYNDWWWYSNKIAVTTAFGTVQGVVTVGLVSPLVSLLWRWHTIARKPTLLQSSIACVLKSSLVGASNHWVEAGGGMLCSSVSVAAIGTACFFLPGSELFGDAAGEAITAVAEAGGHHVAEVVTEGANTAIETGSDHAVNSAITNLTEVSSESSIKRGVEALVQDATTSALNSLHQVLDAVPDALLNIFGVTEAAFEEHVASVFSTTGEL